MGVSSIDMSPNKDYSGYVIRTRYHMKGVEEMAERKKLVI